jgi:hypothetical protein
MGCRAGGFFVLEGDVLAPNETATVGAFSVDIYR